MRAAFGSAVPRRRCRAAPPAGEEERAAVSLTFGCSDPGVRQGRERHGVHQILVMRVHLAARDHGLVDPA